MVVLARYLIHEVGFDYVLLGKLQSDYLEKRFGWIRQMSGSNYFISMRQLIESDNKIKAISLLKFSGFSVQSIDDKISVHSSSQDERYMAECLHARLEFNVNTDRRDDAIIYYVSGACCRSLLRCKKCDSCRGCTTTNDDLAMFDIDDSPEAAHFLNDVDRGGLLSPNETVFQFCILCWKVFYEIKSNNFLRKEFLALKDQRVVYKILMNIIALGDFSDYFLGKSHCTFGHDLISEISMRFFNCMCKNFVHEMTEASNERAVKRKVAKLTNKVKS